MRYCKKCVMPDTRPRATFDKEGVCNACRYREKLKKVDWKQRAKEFKELLDKHKSRSPMGYDCVVPGSCGKDSTYVTYRMKYDYGLRPLAVTVAPCIYTDVGRKNAENFRKIGIDHMVFNINQHVAKKLAKKMFLKYGDPFIPWVNAIHALPARVAINFKIPFVVMGEMGEAMYGGTTDRDDKPEITPENVEKFARTGDAKDWKSPKNWADDEISLRDLTPYIFPTKEELDSAGVKVINFGGYYHQWDGYENYKFIKGKIGFNLVEDRSEGTYTNYASMDDKIDATYLYFMPLKYGFGRATKDACEDIWAGRLTREEAIPLIKKYDTEFPWKYHRDVLEYLDMSQKEFMAVLESFRNKEIWEIKDGEWRLKHPIWEERK